MTQPQSTALRRFAVEAREEYGDRLIGLYAFDYLQEDDEDDDEISVGADVAVILSDGAWSFLDEKKRLARLTFDILLDTEVYVRAWPLPASAWRDPSTYTNPTLVQGIKQRSESIMEAA
jgi:hypothetical protein